MSERNTVLLLKDISEAIQNIFEFTKGLSFESYCTDIKTKHAVEHNFMIIGEAVARLPDDFKQIHKEINWRQVKDFRNVIVHDYFGIDNSIVWDIIQMSLSDLLSDISHILQEETRS
jgi:uncharacterized protein with HEPN domain